MKNVQKIVEAHGHKLDGSDPFWCIRVVNAPYMDLVIEGIGHCPDGRQLVSVTHYYRQGGDLVPDPDMTFLVDLRMAGALRGVDGWFPVALQTCTGYYVKAIEWNAGGDMFKRLGAERELKAFSRTWNKNLGEQRFVEAGLAQAKKAAVEAGFRIVEMADKAVR